jgi:acyl-CoA hydrolase
MSYSTGQITTFVMPHMQNVRGDLFGGELMALVDQAAAVAAIRHAGGPAVTASIERVDFRERIPVGAWPRWTTSATPPWISRSRSTPNE